MDDDKAYFIENIKMKIVNRDQFYEYKINSEQQLGEFKFQTVRLPLRTITINSKKDGRKRISFYYNSAIDEFLGRPFDAIKHLEDSMLILQRRIDNLRDQIKEERRDADIVINQYKELNNKLMSRTFWKRLKNLFRGNYED